VRALARHIISWGERVEVVIGDDAATATLGSELPPGVVYLWDGSRRGQYGNTNRCIAAASGEWIVALNDDDTLAPSILDLIGAAPSAAVIATGKTVWAGAGAEQVERIHAAKLESLRLPGTLASADTVSCLLTWGNPFVCSHTAFRRSVAMHLGGFNDELKYVGDFDLWLRLARHGSLSMADVVVGEYRLHETNHTRMSAGKIDVAIELPYVKAHAWLREGRAIPWHVRGELVKGMTRCLMGRHRVPWAMTHARPLLLPRRTRANPVDG